MNIQGYKVKIEVGQTSDDFIMNRYEVKIIRTKGNKSEWAKVSTRNVTKVLEELEDNFDKYFKSYNEDN